MSNLFASPLSRTLLRATVVALIAVLASLKASVGNGVDAQEWVDMIYAGVAGFAAYLGVGAAVAPVEPFFVNKFENAEVPVPPADPVRPSK